MGGPMGRMIRATVARRRRAEIMVAIPQAVRQVRERDRPCEPPRHPSFQPIGMGESAAPKSPVAAMNSPVIKPRGRNSPIMTNTSYH